MSARRAKAHGLTGGETEIMSLWDSGLRDYAAIATQTGYVQNYVEEVIGRYNVSERILNSFDKMVAAGSSSLLAAIKCFHPDYEALL